MMKNRKHLMTFYLAMLILLSTTTYVLAIEPNGATLNPGNSERAPNITSGNNTAWAGNITFLSVTSFSSTQAWQGYYGNVSGGIELADSGGNVLYNWSLTIASGEVYASTNLTIIWPNVQCFNFTALGNYSTESGTGGSTNLWGTNITQLEKTYNINTSDKDSINATFNNFNHDSFFSANQEFSANECPSVQLYTNSGTPTDGNFEEVILYEPTSTAVIFTSIMDSSVLGFNNANTDFEMIVLEDGHDADVTTTIYYFFVEIE